MARRKIRELTLSTVKVLQSMLVGGSSVNLSRAELGYLDGVATGTLQSSLAAIVGAKGQLDWSGITPTFEASTGRDNAFIKMGTWATPMEVTQSADHWVPIQVNLKRTGNVAYDIAAARLRVDTGGAMALGNLGCLQLRQNIGHNVGASSMINASVNVSAAVAVGYGSILCGYFSIEGSGTITKAGPNDCTPLVAVNNNTGGGIDNVFIAMQNGTGTTVTEIAKIIAVHGTATNGLHIYATATDSSIVTGLRINREVIQGLRIGEWVGSAALGYAVVFSTAMNVNGDNSQYDVMAVFGESAADLGSGKSAKAGRFRHVINGISCAHETYGLIGQVVAKNVTFSHLHSGLMGTFEVNTAATVSIGAGVGCAGVSARVGGATITVGATGILAGFLSTQNATTVSITSGGVHAAFACRKVGSGVTWAEALHIEDALVAIRFKAADASYAHGIKESASTPEGATTHAIKVMIGTTPGYIPVYAAETF